MKTSRFSLVVQLSIIGPIALLLVAYAWVLTRAHLELGGSQPNQQVLGRATTDGQRAMDQTCTGVVNTTQSIWLVGRREIAADRALFHDVLNLDALLPTGFITDANDKEITEIARLGDDGVTDRHIRAIPGSA